DGVPHDIDMTGIVKNLETLTILDYDPSTQKLIYKGEDGIANEFDLIELVSGSETITELLDNGDGTFVYLNEEGTLVTFDANTLTITEAGGVYTFTDAKGPLEEIDTNAEAIAFDNTVTNLLTSTNVQAALDELAALATEVSTLQETAPGIYTYTDETGATTSFDEIGRASCRGKE